MNKQILRIEGKRRIDYTAILVLVLFFLMLPSKSQAATASGETGNIITLSIKDYSTTGANIYNDLLSGRMYSVSYSWESSDPSVTTWREKANTFAYVTFSQPGTYTVKYSLKYSFSGATKSYSFDGTWTVTVTQSGPTGISVTASKYSIYVGEQTTAKANVYGGNGSVTWSKSNNNVSLSESGTTCSIVGNTAGTTTVTARTNNGYSDYVSITVLEHNNIRLSKSDVCFNIGDQETITATITGSNSSTCTWTTSNTNVVTLSKTSGKETIITAVGEGTAKVTAKAYDGTTAVCEVKVMAKAKSELYVVGELTNWEFLDDYKFSVSEDGEDYSLYLEYLSGEFKIASKDWEENYGGAYEWRWNQEETLTPGDLNMTTGEGCFKPYITFNKSTKKMSFKQEAKPFEPGTKFVTCWTCTSLDGGFMGMYVPVGSRFCFRPATNSSSIIIKSLICKDEIFKELLYDNTNHIYLSPVVTDAFVLGFCFEDTSDSMSEIKECDRARVEIRNNKICVTNIPGNVEVKVCDINGIDYGSFIPTNSCVELILPELQVYVISLTNGQRFKVAH